MDERISGLRSFPRLAITLGGVKLRNPLILSSMYYDTAILGRAMGLGWGAVTAKSITPGPRPGHPEPNLVRIETAEGPGLVNCNGFKNPGLEAYRQALAGLPHRVPLIVAAAGESAEDYVRVVEGLQEFGVAVTTFEDAVEAGQGEAARTAEAVLREHMKALIGLVERLSEQAAKL